jgi:polysaccharide biosynthesis transport protein
MMLPEDSSESSMNWGHLWDVVCRRRWWIGLPLFLVWGIVWGVSWWLPSRYRSETTILVDAPKVPEQYVASNVAPDLQVRLQTLTQQILSRTRLQHIIDDFNLYVAERVRLSPDELIERMRTDINVELIQSATKQLTAFKISYSAPSGRVAQAVTSRLTSLFIAENLHASASQSADTTQFLEDQLQKARTGLEQQGKRLDKFKTAYGGQLPTQMQTNMQILSGINTRLGQSNDALNRAEQQKSYFNSLLTRAIGGTDLASTPSELDAQLSRLKAQLADLQAQYTDRHPDVVRLRDQISKAEKLRVQMEGDLVNAKRNQGANGQQPPSIAHIESELKAAELEIKDHKGEIADFQAQIQDYQARLNSTPLREQRLVELSRDYDQARTYYESLLTKTNASGLATNLEKQQQGKQFRVLDPPILPVKPYWPNRMMLSLAGLGIGLAVGAATTYVVDKLDDGIHRDTEVEGLSKGPILVAIPPLRTPREVRMRSWRIWGEALCAAVIVAVIAAANLVTYHRS